MGKTRSKRARSRRPSLSSSSSSSEGDRQRKKIKKLERKISKLTQQVSDSNNRQMSSVINETVIPVFDPSVENLTVTEWVQKVDELSVYHSWSKLMTLKLAASRLRGNARKWYDTAQISCSDWDTVKELLQNNFPGSVKFGKLLVEAAVCVPHPKRNLGDYCFEKVAKLNKLHLPIPDEFLIDSVIEGITDKSVALAARAANFQTVGELASYLSSIGNPGSSKGSETIITKDSFPVRKEQFSSRPSLNSKQKQQQKKVNCYNCGGNHCLNQCRQPKIKCTHCRKFGHTRERCAGDSAGDPRAKDNAEAAACDRPN